MLSALGKNMWGALEPECLDSPDSNCDLGRSFSLFVPQCLVYKTRTIIAPTTKDSED